MKRYLTFLVINIIISNIYSQYHISPSWVKDFNYNAKAENCIYSIGISDPRMSDSILAKDIAITRALIFAVLSNSSEISYTSDYFEKKTEEYRWHILKENIQEFANIKAQTYVDTSNYKILQSFFNTNGEMLVLIKFIPNNIKEANFFVNLEYYKQNYELSNTRSFENISNIKISSNQIITANNKKDSITSFFHFLNWNNSISIQSINNSIEIKIPNYFYTYKNNDSILNISDYISSSILHKGIYAAYIDSFVQGLIILSKNYKSKFTTISDNYNTNKDNTTDNSKETLSRHVSKNSLSFSYSGFSIFNNYLHSRLKIKNDNIITEEIKPSKNGKSSFWLWFKKKYKK